MSQAFIEIRGARENDSRNIGKTGHDHPLTRPSGPGLPSR